MHIELHLICFGHICSNSGDLMPIAVLVIFIVPNKGLRMASLVETCCLLQFFICCLRGTLMVAQLVDALRYKQGSCGLDSR
jgi:hypothetical protein